MKPPTCTLETWHSPKRWWCSPKSLWKLFPTEGLDKQAFLAPVPHSSQALGEDDKLGSTPWNTADQRNLQVPERKAVTNTVLPAAYAWLSQAETPAVIAPWQKPVFHPDSFQPWKILQEVRSILAVSGNSRGKGKTLKPGSSCPCIGTQAEALSSINVVEVRLSKKDIPAYKELPRPY